MVKILTRFANCQGGFLAVPQKSAGLQFLGRLLWDCVKSKNAPDPMPEHFATLEEAAEFWDTHDTEAYKRGLSTETLINLWLSETTGCGLIIL